LEAIRPEMRQYPGDEMRQYPGELLEGTDQPQYRDPWQLARAGSFVPHSERMQDPVSISAEKPFEKGCKTSELFGYLRRPEPGYTHTP